MRVLRWLFLAAQVLFGVRVVVRLAKGARGAIAVRESGGAVPQSVSVILPVLNEADRISGCLDALRAQNETVREILVVDGGSEDMTHALVREASVLDARVRLIAAEPTPPGWNGKAWTLQTGLLAADPGSRAILTIDADVRLAPRLAASIVAHAGRYRLAAFSIAARQELSGVADSLIHPSMLATLVYRFGVPGFATSRVARVQASGQCFYAERELLLRTAAIAAARDSRCEDVTIARALCVAGTAVGFYEAENLVTVKMYDDWRQTLSGWPRSLPMSDRFARVAALVGLCEVVLVQALPLWLLLSGTGAGAFARVQAVLVAMRFGTLAGMRRAYRRPPVTYWLSPLCDLPVALLLMVSFLRRRHTWRGRMLVVETSR